MQRIFKYYLTIENKENRSISKNLPAGHSPIKLNVVAFLESRKRICKSIPIIDKTGNTVNAITTPDIFRALWPEFNKNVIMDNKVLNLRESNLKLKEAVDNSIKHWVEAIKEINTTNKFRITRRVQLENLVNRSKNLYNADEEKELFKNACKLKLEQENITDSTKKSYGDTIAHFINYAGDNLSIFEIDSLWLTKWEKWFEKTNGSPKTMESHSIRLQAILSLVYKSDMYPEYTKEIHFPFGDAINNKYKIKRSQEKKMTNRHLTLEQLEIFKNYVPETESEEYSKDMFFLMYYLAGCYPIDLLKMFYLKNYSKTGNHCSYYRSKTYNTAKIRKVINISINSEAIYLIEKYRNRVQPTNKTMLFPFLAQRSTTSKEPIRSWRKTVNNGLRQIAKKIKIEKLKCDTARHTTFNKMKNEGVPFSKIMEVSGHTSFNTLQEYLDSFEPLKMLEAYDKL